MVDYRWRGPFANGELNALHAAGFGLPVRDEDWTARLERHSLGWVCARDEAGLIGFVNVAWDGGVHAFLLDTVVADRQQRQGVGTGLIAMATAGAREAGCDWLHVDFEEHLRSFYLEAGGFEPTGAGLVALRS